MTKVLATVALSLAAACSQPDYGDCVFSCAVSGSCPGGLSCEEGWCRAEGATHTCGAADDLDGGGGGDPDSSSISQVDAVSTCWTPSPSNIDECALTDPGTDWNIATDVTIDTTTGALLGPAPPVALMFDQEDGTQIYVVVAHAVDLPVGVSLTASGELPLVIVSFTTVTIDGRIQVAARTEAGIAGAGASKACGLGSGGSGTNGDVPSDFPGGGGAGGGGFGESGAEGGEGGCGDTEPNGICDSAGGASGQMGTAAVDLDLSPFHGGCSGGKGGQGTGGAGGLGGGAVQIAAMDSIVVAGVIDAGGGAGEASDGTRGGGGGGGSGGAILLEAFSIGLSSGAVLCANGGGGGGVNSANPSEDGSCELAAAHGNGDGGDGASIDFAPAPGGMGGPREGGGGAGGGLGRIVIRRQQLIEDAGLETPAYGN